MLYNMYNFSQHFEDIERNFLSTRNYSIWLGLFLNQILLLVVILNRNTNRISILKKNTLHKGGLGSLEAEDNNQEEDLVEKEAKLYAMIVGS